MRLEKGTATDTVSRMSFLFILLCLLPGFCHWIRGKSKGDLQSPFLGSKGLLPAQASTGSKPWHSLQQSTRSSHPPFCPAALTYLHLCANDGRVGGPPAWDTPGTNTQVSNKVSVPEHVLGSKPFITCLKGCSPIF